MIPAEQQAAILRKALGRGGEYADLYAERRRHTALVLEDSRIEKIMTGLDAGAGIRLIHDSRTSYAYTNDFSLDSLDAAAAAVSNAAQGGPTGPAIDLRTLRPAGIPGVEQPPDSVAIETKIDLLRTAERSARLAGTAVRQVSVIYRDSIQDVSIATSEGSLAEDRRIYTTFIIQVVASAGSVIQTAYESIGGTIGFELFRAEDIALLAGKTAERAVRMLASPRAPAGRMPVVISSSSGGTMIHEAIGHGLEADLARQGLSVFSGKTGMLVASPLITVIDDATIPFRRGSFRFDDEGVPGRRNVLVDRGILTSYLYDRLSAVKEGRMSTGNGRRESYQHRPIPRMSNTYIAPGSSDPDAILRSVDRGLFVEKIGGGQVNTVTGDFVFDVQEAYLIERGEKGPPVRGATLTGNGPEVLSAIDMVGSDLGFSIGTCGKDAQGVPVSDAMPTVRIPEIVVGGSHRP